MTLTRSRDRYQKQTQQIREAYRNFRQHKQFPEYLRISDLFVFYYEDLMPEYHSHDFESENIKKDWEEQFDEAARKSWRVYTKLKDAGIEVKFDDQLLEKRLKVYPEGPDRFEFHLDQEVIEDLLTYIFYKAAQESMTPPANN